MARSSLPHLRIARPVADPAGAADLYSSGLGMRVLGSFEDHDGFDGVMVGFPGSEHHFEFTRSRTHPVTPAPTPEDLVVFYLPDAVAWEAACTRMGEAGFSEVASFNPYWDVHGRTFEDRDGYRVVLQNAGWDDAGRT